MSVIEDCDAFMRALRNTVNTTVSRTQFIRDITQQLKKEQEVSMEEYDKHVNNLLYCLETIDLAHVNDTEVLCELAVLEILFELDLSTTQLAQCNSYLRLCLHEVHTSEVAMTASKVFAVIANVNTSAEFVREEVNDALSMLEINTTQSESQQLCGILLLIEVALKMPVLILPKLNTLFDHLWVLLATHTDDETRERALTLFSICTKLLGDRQSSVRESTYRSLSRELQDKLSSSQVEQNIAGLIAFEPILLYAVGFASCVQQQELVKLLQSYTSISTTRKSPELLRLLFHCLTICCEQQHHAFAEYLLDSTVRMAWYCIQENISRVYGLEMLSKIIIIVGATTFSKYVEKTCLVVNEIICKTTTPCWEALRCFATLCCVSKPAEMENFVDSFLWQVFSWGITAELIDCMRVIISSASPSYRTSLEETLLDMISITLCGMPFRQHRSGVERLARLKYKWLTYDDDDNTNNNSNYLSSPLNDHYSPLTDSSKNDNNNNNNNDRDNSTSNSICYTRPFRLASQSNEELAVALSALMQFGFSDLELMGDFLRDSVLPFIDHSSDMVRHAAMSTIIKLLLPSCDKTELSVSRRLCVNTIIARMLVVAVTHSSAEVRETLLRSFTEPFYPFLSEPQFLSRLYFALGDEYVNCRVAALELLCRMVKHDPSHILPSIREQMVLALQWISYHGAAHSMETNTTFVHDGLLLLNAIASTAPFFVVNFIESMLQVLRPMFASLSTSMTNLVPFLQCCTSIAEAIRQFDFTETDLLDEVRAIANLLWHLPADRSFEEARLCCLRFMNAVLQPTMRGELVYKLIPDLYRRLSALIQHGEESVALRLEAVRCFGVIGALDAYIFQRLNVDVSDENTSVMEQKAIMMHRITQRKCAKVILNSIAKLLSSCAKGWGRSSYTNSSAHPYHSSYVNNNNHNNNNEQKQFSHSANRITIESMRATGGNINSLNVYNNSIASDNNNNLSTIGSTIIQSHAFGSRNDYSMLNSNARGGCMLPEAVVRSAMQTILIIAERCSCAKMELHTIVNSLGWVICGLQDSRLLVSALLLFSNLMKMVRPAEKAGEQGEMEEVLYEVFCRVWEQLPRYRFLAIRLLSTMTEMSVGAIEQSSGYHVPLLPRVFEAIVDPDNCTTELQLAVMAFIIVHVDTLQGCAEMAINSLLTLIKRVNTALEVKVAALVSLRVLCSKLYVEEFVGAVVRRLLALLPLLARTSKRDIAFTDQSRVSNLINLSTARLLNNVINIFIVLLLRLQADFLRFSKEILHVAKQYNCSYFDEFMELLMCVARSEKVTRAGRFIQRDQAEVREVCKLCEHKVIETAMRLGEAWGMISWNERVDENDLGEERIQHINQERILNTLKTMPLSKEEWIKRSNQFASILLEESPFQILRCIALPIGVNATPLIEKVPNIAFEVEYVAFRTVWNYAGTTLRAAIHDFGRRAFEQALNSSHIPDEVLTVLLTIVEYMEHVGDNLHLIPDNISDCAWNRGMLAKALFWREAAYRDHPAKTVESLITLYSQLHLVDSAVGLLSLADANQRKTLMQSSLMKLSRYTEALELTRQEMANDALITSTNASPIYPHVSSDTRVDNPFTETENKNNNNIIIYSNNNTHKRSIVHHRSYSEINRTFACVSGESRWERYWSNHVRLMMCYSELSDFDAVLDEWHTIFNKFHNTLSNKVLSCNNNVDTTGAISTSTTTISTTLTTVTNHNDNSCEKLLEFDKMHDEYIGDENNILSFIAPYAADASIRLRQYQTLESVLEWMPENVVHFYISNAVLQIAHGNYSEAQRAITSGRTLLLDDLSSLLNESYSRAYKLFVVAQQLTELEEVITAKITEARFQTSEHITLVERVWEERIRTMTPTVAAWKEVLATRALLVPPSENVRTRIRFLKLCRQEKAHEMEKFTLNELIGTSEPSYDELTSKSANPRVVLQYIKYLSAANLLGASSVYGQERNLLHTIINVHDKPENAAVNARIYARLADMVDFHESINYLASATQLDPLWHRAWRSWAEVNVKLLAERFSNELCINAMEGYIHSIQLDVSDSTVIQDVLRLLTLWSKYCDNEQGLRALRRRIFGVPPWVWHLVVPQLIARLDTGSDDSCRLVADILSLVALDYPHTLVYPLNLCTMSDSERRKWCAEDILCKLQIKHHALVSEAREMIDELLRISALVYERWYEKLEAAATAFFGRQSVHDMLNTLLPMYEMFDAAPETVVEAEFNFEFKAVLLMAREWLYSYNRTHNIADVHSAWNLLHSVYKNIDEKLKTTNVLQLQFCSPILFEARNLAIGLPNARTGRQEVVSMISSFHNELHIITSKQRPKRIGIITTEGKLQKFLLKGREDLRLDERVMQLFGLVNILMSSDTRSNKNAGFHIQRYSVTPLNDTAGLIGWVDGCDTLHELVKFYRERLDVPVELEMRTLNQIITLDSVKSYDYLTVMSKVEVMEFLAERTSGHDIRKAMWSSASTCEVWMDQRLMYTTSLANMSMVGYILGLGDRHPNNIMLQRSTGLVVHIDFGDCFEVAMTREKFPEKVPFRLTRMLRSALDVSSINGTFCANAETAMSVLRENRESVLALFEAFLQDPLISWRLVNRPGYEPELSNDHKVIEEQIKMANLREQNLALQQGHSISASINNARREIESQSVAKHLFGEEVDVVHQGVLILKRLSSKLEGIDFITSTGVDNLDVPTQVQRLIDEAVDISNIAQSWSGWYPFW